MNRAWACEAFRFLVVLAFACGGGTMAATSAATERQELVDFAMREHGDPALGQRLFADENRVACAKCHSTDGSAHKAGPDLAGIGDKFPRRELIRSVLEPSAVIAVGYGTTIVQTKDDETAQGIIKQATDSWIELVGADGQPKRISINDILNQRTSEISLMPEGLERGLSRQGFANLIAYLESLHQPITNTSRVHGIPEEIAQVVRPVDLVPFFDKNVRLHHPLWYGEMPGITNRFVVLEQEGRGWIIDCGGGNSRQSALVDLSKEVRVGGATGLLSLAFHPEFKHNRKYYLKYQVLRDGKIFTRLVERRFSDDFTADSGLPALVLLEIGSVTQDHNGGALAFGPDGFLYFGMGDTGPQRDPQGHGQNLNILWGKILRLDVDHPEGGRAYGIPTDNPFVNRSDARQEIWAYGFREPWRMSFDRATGDLWVGDVGQDRVEEITVVCKGENHGWNVFEGHAPFSEQYRRPGETYIAPVFSYTHRLGVSVTGGYVYRGERAPQMRGWYVCGDFESRRIWALTQTNRQLGKLVEIGRAPTRIVSFGEDHTGELYLVGYDAGMVYRMNLADVDPRPRQTRIIAATSEESPVLWRYTLEGPTSSWFTPEFNDSAWRISPGGFGAPGTPGAVVRTEWRTSEIWLRRSFTIASSWNSRERHTLALRLHHDEDAEVYLNGVEIAKVPQWTTGYVELPLDPAASRALKPGANELAIHCRQISGGQYIDAGLLEYHDPLMTSTAANRQNIHHD